MVWCVGTGVPPVAIATRTGLFWLGEKAGRTTLYKLEPLTFKPTFPFVVDILLPAM
jgi:hypothetical protein